MPRYALQYPKEPFNTVHRYSARASYELRTIHSLINSAPLVHVAFQEPDSPFPAILPMIGQMGSFARPSADLGDVLDLYLHGYVSSRFVNRARLEDLPVSISASHVDGLVLSLTPNSHSFNFRSAVLFGHANVVTDTEERLYAMQLITDCIVPGRWKHTRVPPNAGEMQSTAVLRVRIAGGSAKIRVGPPNDSPGDMADEALRERVWVGVLPVHTTLGAPIPAEYNMAALPDHVTDFHRDFNAEAAEHAVAAASAKDP